MSSRDRHACEVFHKVVRQYAVELLVWVPIIAAFVMLAFGLTWQALLALVLGELLVTAVAFYLGKDS